MTISPVKSGSLFNAWVYHCGLVPLFSTSWRLAAQVAQENLPPEARVLDYGCGGGALLKRLLKQNFVCTGVEWNAWLLQEAGRRLTQRHPWGKETGADLILADTTQLPVSDNSFDAVVNFLGLHSKSQEEQDCLFTEFRRLAPVALLMDWQQAERNIDIPLSQFSSLMVRTVDFMGGRQHTAHIRNYYRMGALEGILYRNRERLTVIHRRSCLCGSMGLALVRWL